MSCRPQRRTAAGLVVLAHVALALAGCGDQLVEVPTDRPPAALAVLKESKRCPPDTVLLTDDDPSAGAGSIPTGFDGRTVLRCEVDYTTVRIGNGIDSFTVRQWQATLTPELRTAFDLPNRELRSRRGACASSAAGTTALYVVDSEDHAVRILPPTDEPCQVIRQELRDLLPATDGPADDTFTASRTSR